MIGIGVWSYRHMRSLDDFAIAGRRLGPWVTAISERASGESAWFLLGLPGAAYALGFTEFWSVIGIAFGIFASWVLIARPLRRETERLGAITLPEYFELRFQDRSHFLRVLSTVVILFFYTIYVGAQFIGAGKILNATFGIHATLGMLIGAGVVVIYTLLGGFLAVAWTDLIQGLMMAAVSLVLPILAIAALGGPGAFVETLAAQGEGFLSMSGGKVGAAFFFGVMVGNLSWGFGYLGQPHLLVRYMAIRSTREIRHSTAIAMGWVLLAYWGVAFVGLAAVGVLGPDIADPEHVMPLMARALLPGWIAGLFIAGAVAAMMSTADSQLLVAASSLVEDVYSKLLGKEGTRERLLLLSRIATVLIAGIALALAFASRDLIYDLVAYAWSGLGASFGPPLVLALWWRGTTRSGAIAGMAGGLVTAVLWKNAHWLGVPEAATDLLDIKWFSFAVSLTLTVAVSLATRGGARPEAESPAPPA
jgi:sodium/proline symporter